MHNLQWLQQAAGNQAVSRLLSKREPVVQRSGEDMAATLQGRAQQQIEAAKAASAAKADAAAGESGEQPAPPSPEQVAAEKAKQRRAISGAVAVPDTGGAKSEATSAAGAVKAEAAPDPGRAGQIHA